MYFLLDKLICQFKVTLSSVFYKLVTKRKLMTETVCSEKTLPKATVIGSGFGGLAAAIRMQKKGYQTTVYELSLIHI